MKGWQVAAMWAAGFAGVVLISYLLALSGEPQAVWLWRDVLGVMLLERG